MSDVTLADAGHAHAPMTKTSFQCAVHRHTEWVPENEHHIWPQGMGGPNTASNQITVCTNGHYMIHEFMDRLARTAGHVPWEEARHFGPKVRRLAQLGWEQAGRPGPGHHGSE